MANKSANLTLESAGCTFRYLTQSRMKIIREITFHEMLRRFAIGEVFSEFYDAPTDEHRNKTLLLLKSGEQNKEIEGIKRALAKRQCLVKSGLHPCG